MATYQYTVEGTDYEVDILEVQDKVAKVTVNGVEFEVELKRALKPTTRPIQQVQAAPKATTPAAAPQPKPECLPVLVSMSSLHCQEQSTR